MLIFMLLTNPDDKSFNIKILKVFTVHLGGRGGSFETI